MINIIIALLVGALIGFTLAAAVAVGTYPYDDDGNQRDDEREK
jgi:ethanolamine transporter EutH